MLSTAEAEGNVISFAGTKIKYWTKSNVNLIVTLDKKSQDQQSEYNLSWGVLDVCRKFHGNPRWDISLKATDVDIMKVLEEKPKAKVTRIHNLGTTDVSTIFCANLSS